MTSKLCEEILTLPQADRLLEIWGKEEQTCLTLLEEARHNQTLITYRRNALRRQAGELK